jgi:hypothetical protein
MEFDNTKQLFKKILASSNAESENRLKVQNEFREETLYNSLLQFLYFDLL